MGKIKIGSVNHQTLIKGDINLLGPSDILVSESEGYTILRKKDSTGKIKTFIVIPLEEFKLAEDNSKGAKGKKPNENNK